MHPQQHGRERPEAAGQIQRAKTHLGESAPLRPCAARRPFGFFDGKQGGHEVGAIARRERRAAILKMYLKYILILRAPGC
ncbi:hypothetical protein D3C72_1004580 [compost metagenome]